MEKKQTFSVHTERDVKLTVEDIDDIMVAALEGGINYWCSEAEVVEERRCADWGHEQIARGGALVLHDVEDIDEKWELDLEKFLLSENADIIRHGSVEIKFFRCIFIHGRIAERRHCGLLPNRRCLR